MNVEEQKIRLAAALHDLVDRGIEPPTELDGQAEVDAALAGLGPR